MKKNTSFTAWCPTAIPLNYSEQPRAVPTVPRSDLRINSIQVILSAGFYIVLRRLIFNNFSVNCKRINSLEFS